MTKLALSSSINSASFINNLKNSNSQDFYNKIQNLYTRTDKERGAMVLQNTHNTTRNSFNFRVFSPVNKRESLKTVLEDHNKKLNQIIKVSNCSVPDSNRKINENLVTNVNNFEMKTLEFYREVVTDKSKIESILW